MKKRFKYPVSKIGSFTLIELLVVIAIIAITLRSKSHFFLLFSAILDFLPLLQRIHNFQKRDVTL